MIVGSIVLAILVVLVFTYALLTPNKVQPRERRKVSLGLISDHERRSESRSESILDEFSFRERVKEQKIDGEVAIVFKSNNAVTASGMDKEQQETEARVVKLLNEVDWELLK